MLVVCRRGLYIVHGRLWSGCGACVVHSEWVVLLVVATLLLLTMAGTYALSCTQKVLSG